MKKIILMIVAVFAFTMSALAQQTTVEGSRFFDNTYVGVSVGGQVGLTDMRGHGNWTVAPVGGLYLGKWITPTVGLELNGDALFHDGFTSRNRVVDASYVGLNARLNLNNVFHRYKGEPDRVEVVPFIGLGWLHSYGTGVADVKGNVPTSVAVGKNAMGTKMGIDLNIHVDKERSWAINVRPNVVYALTGYGTGHYNPKYDVRYGRLGLDVGFTHKFRYKTSSGVKTHNFVQVRTNAEYDEMTSRILGRYREYRKHNPENVEPKTVEVVKEVVKEVVVEKEPQTVYVFSAPYFKQGRYVLDYSGEVAVAVIADEIMQGDKDAKYVITGYASVEGEESYNNTLSLNRAKAVRNELVKRGVDPERLTVVAGGETEKFGKELNQNRTVVINQAE